MAHCCDEGERLVAARAAALTAYYAADAAAAAALRAHRATHGGDA